MKKPGPTPPEMRELILDLRAAGWSEEQIGVRVGKTAGAVGHIIQRARAKGDPRAARLTEEQRRWKIIAARNAALGRPMPDALRGGWGVSPLAPAALSSSGPRSVRAETPAGSPVTAGGVSSQGDCAGSGPPDPAAFWREVADAYEGGETIYSLSQRLGYHQTTIRRKLSRFGLFNDPNDSKPQQKLEPAMRRCLGGCGKQFHSKWAGHRICDRCRGSEGAGAWR